MPPSIRYKEEIALLPGKVAGDPQLLSCLEHTFIQEERIRFTAALQDLLPQDCQLVVKDVWSSFLTYCK